MHRVVVLTLPGVVPFELGIPDRVFGLAQDAGGRPLYDVRTCGLEAGPVSTVADFSVSVEHGCEALAAADTVVIPTHATVGPVYEQGVLPSAWADALAHVRPGARLVSICSAAFVLAAAGRLDGRPATTHWRHASHFRRLFPRVQLDADVLFVDDGDVLSSAGVASGIDLCLHILRRDHGSAVANDVARRCIVPPSRAGGQAQFIERPMPKSAASATTESARAWAIERIDQPLQLSDLAAHSAMSVRTFTRRFRAEVGLSPGRWLLQQRVEQARHLLELTDVPVEEVAQRAGFGTAASLRQHFNTAMGVAPSAYRRTFRTTPVLASRTPVLPGAR